jgi:hypothetical protein
MQDRSRASEDMMFSTQCRCGATNDATAERCFECGASLVPTTDLTNSPTSPATGSGVALYWLLGGSVTVIAAACVVTTLVGIAPILGRDLFSKRLAYGLSAVAAALVIAGVAARTRVPQRSAMQSTSEYWSLKEVTSAAALTWFLLEAAVTLAGVAYFLTGDPVAAIGLCAAIVAFAWCHPRDYARQ